MAKLLTGLEISGILAECRANGTLSEYRQGPETFVRAPQFLARGYRRKICLRPGLHLSIMDFRKRQIHQYQIRQHPPSMPLTLNYYLTGGCQVSNDGLKTTYEEVAGKSYLYCLPNTAELEKYPAECRICRIQIQISPELLQGFSDRTGKPGH